MIILLFYSAPLFFRRDETARPVFGYHVHQHKVYGVPCAADVRNGGVVDGYGKIKFRLRLYNHLKSCRGIA